MQQTGLCDIHCHILPNVDDGSRNMEESLKMLQTEYDDGVRYIMLTPHFRYQMFEPPLEKVKQTFAELQKQSKEKWPDLTLRLGSEIHKSLDITECLKKGERLTLGSTNYVLLEFSGSDPKSLILERTLDLLNHGYKPIIAHIERYSNIRDDFAGMEELKDMGAFIQVNADTISGKDGFFVKRYARKLMKRDLIDFVGTDAHRSDSRTPGLLKAYEQAAKTNGSDYADWLFIDNPSLLFTA